MKFTVMLNLWIKTIKLKVMKREILFKGKRLDNGKWCFGSVQVPRDGTIPVFDKWFMYDDKSIQRQVEKDTVCEYAGFADKNGNKVFEGDYDKEGNCVVFCDECHGWQFGEIDIPTKDICIPCHACDGNFLLGDVINDFEVIGNIND